MAALGTELGVATGYSWSLNRYGGDEEDLSSWTVGFHAGRTVALRW